MSRRRLEVLYLDAVPGIGIQHIVGTEDRIDSPAPIPEVEVQPVPAGVIVHLPHIAAVGVACDGELGATCDIAADTEGEAREGLGLLARRQSRVDVDVLSAGIVQRERIRAAIDHRALHGCTARAIAAR